LILQCWLNNAFRSRSRPIFVNRRSDAETGHAPTAALGRLAQPLLIDLFRLQIRQAEARGAIAVIVAIAFRGL
jgi:hypothetical protein